MRVETKILFSFCLREESRKLQFPLGYFTTAWARPVSAPTRWGPASWGPARR